MAATSAFSPSRIISAFFLILKTIRSPPCASLSARMTITSLSGFTATTLPSAVLVSATPFSTSSS